MEINKWLADNIKDISPVKLSGIYAIYCIPSDRIYIGQSTSINRRWTEHKTHLNNNKHINPVLQASWNKYGSSLFSFFVLEEGGKRELDEKEGYYASLFPVKQLMNCAAIEGVKELGLKHTEESKKKMSEVWKNRKPVSEETRARLREAWKTRGKVSDETKKKLSYSAKVAWDRIKQGETEMNTLTPKENN